MTTGFVAIYEGDMPVDERDAPRQLLATIHAAKAGDHRAFEEIMLATEERVARLAWRILGDAEEVKEATQETFLRLYRHLGRYDESGDFDAWLYRIAVNVCRDRARRRRRRQKAFLALGEARFASDRPDPERAIDARAEVELLGLAIDALPLKQRLAITLREVEELPTETVVAILGTSTATVRVQVSKARTRLRQWIASRGKGAV